MADAPAARNSHQSRRSQSKRVADHRKKRSERGERRRQAQCPEIDENADTADDILRPVFQLAKHLGVTDDKWKEIVSRVVAGSTSSRRLFQGTNGGPGTIAKIQL